MRKLFFACLMGIMVNVNADEISLFDWGLNIDGAIFNSASDLPANATVSDGFFAMGLGTITIMFGAEADVTTHSGAAFLDYEIDEAGTTFFNEYGIIEGTSDDARLSYEIDEPGFGNGAYTGDIYDNFVDFQTSGFDGKVFYDGITGTSLSDFENPISDDVAMGMGWKFALNTDETAWVEYTVSATKPTSGLYLAQMDRNSEGTAMYLQSRLNISPNVPEPGLISLLGIGLIVIGFFRRVRNRKWFAGKSV